MFMPEYPKSQQKSSFSVQLRGLDCGTSGVLPLIPSGQLVLLTASSFIVVTDSRKRRSMPGLFLICLSLLFRFG
jgi:hypothetical protein